MSYINKILNKNSDELSEKDVEDFFSTPQEETPTLEFKSGEVEIEDLHKEITAFLNTEGGLIIVGSPKETKQKVGKLTKVTCVGPLVHSKFRSKDWLQQKIYSNISPAPLGINIEEFISEEGAIFLIEILQSSNPPHQSSSNGKYYIRIEKEAKAAPHGVVQALFDRRREPELYGYIDFIKKNDYTDSIIVKIINNSPIPADKLGWIIDIYNIRDIEGSRKFRESFDDPYKKFVMADQSSGVLVQKINISEEFDIIHGNHKYLIRVGYWCKSSNIKFRYGVYDPLTQEVSDITSWSDDKGDYEKDIVLAINKLTPITD